MTHRFIILLLAFVLAWAPMPKLQSEEVSKILPDAIVYWTVLAVFGGLLAYTIKKKEHDDDW